SNSTAPVSSHLRPVAPTNVQRPPSRSNTSRLIASGIGGWTERPSRARQVGEPCGLSRSALFSPARCADQNCVSVPGRIDPLPLALSSPALPPQDAHVLL